MDNRIDSNAKKIIAYVKNNSGESKFDMNFTVNDKNNNIHNIRLYFCIGEGAYGSFYQYTFTLECKGLGVKSGYSLITESVQQEGWHNFYRETGYSDVLLEEVLELVLTNQAIAPKQQVKNQ